MSALSGDPGARTAGIAAALALALILVGCQTGVPETIVVPRSVGLAAEVVPWHVHAVVGAAVERLRGASEAEVAEALSVDGAGAIEPEPRFRYTDFAVPQVRIVSLDALEGGSPGQRLAFRLHLQDQMGRRTAIAVRADYRVAGDRVAVEDAAWAPLFSQFPRAEMLVVPAVAVKDGIEAASNSYRDLFLLVQKHALPMKDPGAVPRGVRDHVIFVFLKDRIAPDAKFEVLISKGRAWTTGYKWATRYRVYDDGWMVAMLPGRFDPSSASAFWVKAVYTPGSQAPENQRGKRVIGLFSTAPIAPAEAPKG